MSENHSPIDADNSGGADQMGPPASGPCRFCPYRRDVPSGVWSYEEYEKLRQYDLETWNQPPHLFQCHVFDAESALRRMCAGWVGCHGEELLSLRVAVRSGHISHATVEAAPSYRSPVPLFASGNDAADHGQADIECPSPEAVKAINSIIEKRSDLT